MGKPYYASLVLQLAYLETGESVDVPDAEDPGGGEADDVLVSLVARDVNDGEQVAHQFT